MNPDPVVRICYAAVRQYLEECGAEPGQPWGKLTEEHRDWWRGNVGRALNGHPPRKIHEAWYEAWMAGEKVVRPGHPHAEPVMTSWDNLSDIYQTVYFLIQMTACALTIGAVPAFAGREVTPL